METGVADAGPGAAHRTPAADLIGWLCVAFGAAYAVFIVGPAVVKGQFGPLPLLHIGDVLDLATPLVILPLSWLLLWSASADRIGPLIAVGFTLLAAALAMGHGMHLAANAVHNEMDRLGMTVAGEPLSDLVYLIDEPMSHLVWHGATIAIAAAVVGRALRDGEGGSPRPALGGPVLGGLLFGATWFAMIIEGQSWPVMLPATVALGLVLGVLGRSRLRRQHPQLVLFAVGFCVTGMLALAWAGLNGWSLPEFSAVDLI